LTDCPFSGVSTGACIGHIGPKGLRRPDRKVLDGDVIRIEDRFRRIEGSVNLVGEGQRRFSPEKALESCVAAKAPGSGPARLASRRHSALGGSASRQAANIGWLRSMTRQILQNPGREHKSDLNQP